MRKGVVGEVREGRGGLQREAGGGWEGRAVEDHAGGFGLLRRLARDAPWLACWCHEPASAPSRPRHASRSRATDTVPPSS